MAELFLGGVVDPGSHERTGDEVRIDTADLTTHGVIVGMTGSGKTGLGVVLIEEVLSAGIPALLIDPKGDLTNLCLTFPELAAGDFRPWIDDAQAKEAGQTPDEFAAAQATTWTEGLNGWGYGPAQIVALRERVDFTIYTPGSQSGVALNIVGSLDAPATTDNEAIADQIEGFVSGLLGLIGVDADPLSSREHILLSNLIHHAWTNGQSLDLPTLVGQVQQPPIAKLGVFELNEFFPAKDRTAFAVKLNGLLASPSFASWGQGVALDIQSMLYRADGTPRCAIVTTAHLSDEERQFVTSLVLGKLITWMRAQSGTTDLRALLYMDEVAGYLPPTAMPATKKPIMTLMKQARAFGVGVVLSTQNPVDIDYKAISNAGTWMVGRLQTERDRDRLLDGMSAADGGVDVKMVGSIIGGLAKREFVLRRAGKDTPEVLTSRWAMSYLRGPMTRDQIAQVTKGATPAAAPDPAPAAAAAAAAPAASAAPAEAATADAGADASAESAAPEAASATESAAVAASAPTAAATGDTTPVMPTVASGITVRWIDASLDAVAELGGDPAGTTAAPIVLAEIHARYDDTKLDLATDTTFTLAVAPLTDRLDATTARDVALDLSDLLDAADTTSGYRISKAPLGDAAAWKQFNRDLVDHVVRNRPLAVQVNKQLKLASQSDESAEDFQARCANAAQSAIDEAKAKVNAAYETKSLRLRDQREAAADRAQVVSEQAAERKRGTWLRAAGDLVGGLFGSKRGAASKLGRAAERLTKSSDGDRVDEARNKVGRIETQQAELDAKLATDLADVEAKWATIAADIATADVPAEKADVKVAQLILAWLPVS